MCTPLTPQQAAANPGDPNAPVVTDFLSARFLGLTQVTANGRQRITGLSLADLQTQANGVRPYGVRSVCFNEKIGNWNFSRNVAQWIRLPNGSCIVEVGELGWPDVPGYMKPLLAVHETFGCLGITDENFGCTTLLDLISNDSDYNDLQPSEKDTLQRDLGLLCQFAGSAGVGGGGDWKPLKKRPLAGRYLHDLAKMPKDSPQRNEVLNRIEGLLLIKFEQD